MPRPNDRVRTQGLALGIVALLASAVLGASLPRAARSQEHAFAGSLQLSYLGVPTDPNARRLGFDGFVTEVNLKMTADINDHISGQVKVCYGCHGFELPMAFMDLRVVDELNFRVGRFNPSFGEFPLRADPANHASVDKPLPYDMGRMLRIREFNLGILPAPYVDTGVEVNGTHWFGDSVQFDYAAYVVGGLRGANDALDVDFVQSRSSAFYYVDNNSQPAVGGRVALTFTPGDRSVMTFGASTMWGHYDPGRDLAYFLAGADAYLRFDRLIIRGEYLIRRTDMAIGSDPSSIFQYGPGADGVYDDFFLKQGWYVEAEQEVTRGFRILARFDGLSRHGNVPIGSPLRSRSSLYRYTLGMNVLPHPAIRIKVFGEYYDFSDFEDAVALEAAVAAAF